VSVGDAYLDLARELLAGRPSDGAPLGTKRMFGGVGICAGELFCALVADDVLYLKADDGNRPDFEAQGLAPSATPARTAAAPAWPTTRRRRTPWRMRNSSNLGSMGRPLPRAARRRTRRAEHPLVSRSLHP